MRRHLYLIALLLTCIQMTSFAQSERMKYNFNLDWKLFTGDDSTARNVGYVDKTWKSISLPYAFNEKEAFSVPISQHTGRVVWYRKTFVLPANLKNKKVFIEFEGARQAAEVWVNGKWVGLHEDGVMAFGYDLTNFVTFGSKRPNVIAVRVDNTWTYKERATGTEFQWNNSSFNANYGGLTKNVYLHVTDKLYQTLPLYNNLKTAGVYIYAKDFSIKDKKAVLEVESEVRNEYSKPKQVKLNVLVRDADKLFIREFSSEEVTLKPGEIQVLKASATMKNLNFWSWGYGYLYEVTTSLSTGKKIDDIVKTKVGFRKTEFKNGLFKLNDRVLQVKGYAQRSTNEWPGVGSSVPAWLSDYSNNLMVQSNANLVRWMHVTPWKQDVESCDRIGLLEAMPAGDAEKDSKGRQWEQRKDLMRDAIIYNRNNPSIIFYECGNESISEEHMAEMLEIRNQYDANGGRAMGAREMLDSRIAEYGGEMLYINKSATKPVWAMEYCRDEALRQYWDEQSYPYHKQGDGPLYRNADASAYNQNQDMFAFESVVRWYDYWRERPGTGKRVSSGGVSIIFSDSNTHCRGAENYRRSGKVDAMRIPKDAYFAHQVMWDGWVDVENFRTHIVGHWNYDKDVVKNVYVVSTGDKVELFLNGKSLGFGEQTNRFWYTFKDVKFVPGTIRAVSYDSSDRKLSEDVIRTTNASSALKLTRIEDSNPFMADGADMVLAQVEVIDNRGDRCPLANDPVTYHLQGPAEFIGGIGKGEHNCIGDTILPVEAGINRVLIRSTRKSGSIRLIVTSGSLTPDTLDVTALPVEDKDGLSTYLPATERPAHLDRGPTPRYASFLRMSRIPVTILGATAGANEKDASLSYDDNELTEWRNNGTRSSGWIKYDLSRVTEVSEVCMKLTGWRSRSYNIRILAQDGTVLWEGLTPKSLGYITLPLKKGVETRSIRIELAGSGVSKDAYSNIVEVDKNKNLDLFDSKSPDSNDPKEELRIVEIEFYESAE